MQDRILASVNGSPITENDVTDAILSMGQRGKSLMNPQGRQMVLEELIGRRLILSSAKKDLLEFDPEFKRQLAALKDELLTKFAVERILADVKITEAEVRAFYNENPEQFQRGETVTASHILTDSEEKAKKIREEIASGKLSFAEAARAYSTCPSAESGGDLGAFERGQMVKEFEDAAFSLEPGALSEPVATQFGYHLITVRKKEEAGLLPFEEVKEPLTARLLAEKQQKAYASRVNQLKILFPVDRY